MCISKNEIARCVHSCLILGNTTKRFSKLIEQVHTPTSNVESCGTPFSPLSLDRFFLFIFVFFFFYLKNMVFQIVMSHCAFNEQLLVIVILSKFLLISRLFPFFLVLFSVLI